ncbi:protein of unknown function [Propionibacterium cyclohexanicum]|uniref:DUF1707 domain-containing protein n=2 Tax=Propionibacterium cyclohexanicum TaxID=64702 RepID=A0A1H9TUF6_9ACTN|nr:protein of unknown function [Propionibacterium cyclohexanicum]
MRIGDAERDEAVARLREHYARGRLSASEFEERMGTAMAAHTRSELVPLFRDLPRDPDTRFFTAGTATSSELEPHASSPAPSPAKNLVLRRTLDVAMAVAWPLAIIAILAGGPWWVILVPVLLLPALRAGMFGSDAERQAREQRREARRENREERRQNRGERRPPSDPHDELGM